MMVDQLAAAVRSPPRRHPPVELRRAPSVDGCLAPGVVDPGVDWYFNKLVKVYFDWEHAMLPTQWLLLVREGGFQRVRVLAVEHELTSLVMHRRPRGYDARISLRFQLDDSSWG